MLLKLNIRLIEFYNKAQEIIAQEQPDILQRTESGTQLYLKADQASHNLTQKLILFDYSFSAVQESDGFIRVLQPVIPYTPGDCYGYIPEEMRDRYGFPQ